MDCHQAGWLGQMIIPFGLEPKNIANIKAGRPATFDLEQIGLRGRVVITTGETDAAIVEEITRVARESGALIHTTEPPKGELKTRRRRDVNGTKRGKR